MDLKKLLIEGSKQIDVNIDENKANKFLKYKDLLLDWNEKVNLTAIIDEEEVIVKHFIDSLSLLKFKDLSNKRIIDVGTGAGFPGLPLRIADESIELTLLDSLNKRINFLREVEVQLGLENVELVHGRAEDFGVDSNYREEFDISLSRAVANIATLSEYCLPFVKVGGYFISLKGPEVDDELIDGQKAIGVLGGEVEEIKKITLPFTDITHSIVFIKKIKQTPTIYPRKAGKPSKDPIK